MQLNEFKIWKQMVKYKWLNTKELMAFDPSLHAIKFCQKRKTNIPNTNTNINFI